MNKPESSSTRKAKLKWAVVFVLPFFLLTPHVFMLHSSSHKGECVADVVYLVFFCLASYPSCVFSSLKPPSAFLVLFLTSSVTWVSLTCSYTYLSLPFLWSHCPHAYTLYLATSSRCYKTDIYHGQLHYVSMLMSGFQAS